MLLFAFRLHREILFQPAGKPALKNVYMFKIRPVQELSDNPWSMHFFFSSIYDIHGISVFCTQLEWMFDKIAVRNGKGAGDVTLREIIWGATIQEDGGAVLEKRKSRIHGDRFHYRWLDILLGGGTGHFPECTLGEKLVDDDEGEYNEEAVNDYPG